MTKRTAGVVSLASVAPSWHTALLVGLVLAVAISGIALTWMGATVLEPRAGAGESKVANLYVPAIAVQWLLALYVCRIGRPSNALRDLLGPAWCVRERVMGDLAIALGLFVLIVGTALALQRFAQVGRSPSVESLLPRRMEERAAWIVVALSAGICEEIVFRGYLLAQFTSLTGNPVVALVIQALLFGVAHANQGAVGAAVAGASGLLFGLVAWRRRSLLPCIACHVALDLAAGFA